MAGTELEGKVFLPNTLTHPQKKIQMPKSSMAVLGKPWESCQ